ISSEMLAEFVSQTHLPQATTASKRSSSGIMRLSSCRICCNVVCEMLGNVLSFMHCFVFSSMNLRDDCWTCSLLNKMLWSKYLTALVGLMDWPTKSVQNLTICAISISLAAS